MQPHGQDLQNLYSQPGRVTADGPEGNLPSSPPIVKGKKVSKNEIAETLTGGIDLSRDWREAVGLSIINSEDSLMMVATRPRRGDAWLPSFTAVLLTASWRCAGRSVPPLARSGARHARRMPGGSIPPRWCQAG